MSRDPLERIAAALERLIPAAPLPTDWYTAPAFVWNGTNARSVDEIEAPALEQLCGIDRQKAAVLANVERLARGEAAHDMLLWGARGMGKSALVRAVVADIGYDVALVQVAPDALATLPALFTVLAKVRRNFLVYLDDLGFAQGDSVGPRHLRSWLEGGVEARPHNVRLAVTSNRRAIVPRYLSEQGVSGEDGPVNPRDALDDLQALADRFGLSVGFHAASQDDYLAIVSAYAEPLGLAWDEGEALQWAKRRGARSGRTAWQFVTEIAGRARQPL